jgi:DNA uptake protein ComE-like DNA-binding protein
MTFSGTTRAIRSTQRGSVLIIVMWVCLGLIALTLYFANSMGSELRAADNRVAEASARQAVAGGIRYASYVLTHYATGGAVPDIEDYQAGALPVGDAKFWFIGRNTDEAPTNEPYFSLVDESSKLNLNTATRAMLEALPGMTPELADAIITWRRASGATTTDDLGGSDNTYSQLDPPRRNKGGPFESVDELRLAYGATLDIIVGEDANRNGALDANEDDGEQSAPYDNQDGALLAGILEYVTVYSRQPTTSASGARRINITNAQGRGQLAQRLTQAGITQQRATQIMQRLGNNEYTSVADFMLASQMTADEFALIHTEVTASTGAAQGLVNVNTASETVLACIPGIGVENASTLVAFRLAHRDELTSMHWLTQVLTPGNLRRAGQYITDQSYQFSADVAAVGHNGRGYCREKVVFDVTAGTPRIVYRQDLTAFGWALGTEARSTSRAAKDT